MNCRQFENDLPDWIADRLPARQAERMQAHHAACPACRQAALDERALRQRWQDALPTAAMAPVWPRLAQRLDSAPPQRMPLRFPVWSLGSAAAACGLLGALLWMHTLPGPPKDVPPPPSQVAETQVDEHHIIQLISQIQEVPEEEGSSVYPEMQQDRQIQRRLLLPKENQ